LRELARSEKALTVLRRAVRISEGRGWRRTAPFVAVIMIAASLAGAGATPEEVCGTGRATSERASTLADWAKSQLPPRPSKLKTYEPQSEANASYDILVMPADGVTVPYLHQFDLRNSSLLFTPRDAASYTVTRGAAVADADTGTALTLTATPPQAQLHLPFPLRVFERTIQDVYVSARNAISAEPQTEPSFWQYDALEVLSQRSPLIAPLLTTEAALLETPRVYVKSAADSVTVTWTTSDYDVRTTLFPDGRIRFSYVRGSSTIRGGSYVAQSSAVVVTSGSESWRTTVVPLGASGGVAGGVDPAAPGDLVPMLDVTEAAVNRVAGLDLLRTELKLAGDVNMSVLGAGGRISYSVTFSSATQSRAAWVNITTAGATLEVPRVLNGYYSGSDPTSAVRVAGRTVSFDITDDIVGFVPTRVTITDSAVRNNVGYAGDRVTLQLAATPPVMRAMTDFASLVSGSTLQVVAEAFARPTVNLYGVWDRIRSELGYPPEYVDAVAVWQNFRTDIDFFATAYALPGNPAVDGIGRGTRTTAPRFPSLLQMNDVSVFAPSPLTTHLTTLLHEFGHRWLMSVAYRTASGTQSNLNPDNAHPAQYVDTRAAFAVASDHDCSVMGGAVFSFQGDGSYAIAKRSAVGYSWLDLYLMGLAAPEDVPPFFYLAGTSPALGIAYWPSTSIASVRGTRADLTVGQVIASEGPRVPAYPATQREFRVLFVLLVDPAYSVSGNDVDVVRAQRDIFLRDLPVATGGRARAVALSPTPYVPQRQRSVRH
jgi:hypothetical protein